MRIRRCLPCGQRRCRVARRIMACRGRKRGLKAFCPSGEFPGAPGNGDVARCPTGNGDTRPPANGTRSSSRRPLPPYPMRRPASTPHRHHFSRRTSGACAQHRLPSPANSQHFALPVAPHPQTIPQGDRRALPAPAQGSSLDYHCKCNRKERIGHRKALC